MSVRQETDRRGKEVWVADIRIKGGPRVRWTAGDQEEAEKIETRLKAAILEGRWKEMLAELRAERHPVPTVTTQGEVQVGTVSQLIDRYWEDYVLLENRSPATKRTRLKFIRQCLGEVAPDQVTKKRINDFIRCRRRAGVSSATINKDVAVLRHLLRWAVEEEYLAELAFGELKRLKEDDPDLEHPTETAIDAVLGHLPPLIRPIFIFIRETGCRRGEALRLRHDQLVLEGPEPLVRLIGTKTGKSREVGLTQQAVAALGTYPPCPGSPYAFSNPKTGLPWTDLKRPWEQARQKAGYPRLRVHDLRSALGIKLSEQGVPMHYIQYVLGHTSVRTTEERYAKFRPDAPRRYVLRVLEGGRRVEVA